MVMVTPVIDDEDFEVIRIRDWNKNSLARSFDLCYFVCEAFFVFYAM